MIRILMCLYPALPVLPLTLPMHLILSLISMWMMLDPRSVSTHFLSTPLWDLRGQTAHAYRAYINTGMTSQ